MTGQGPPSHQAAADMRRAVDQHARILAEQHQRLIDAEVRQSRRDLRSEVRRRTGAIPAILDDYFLEIADRPAILTAIVEAGCVLTGATSCDLQTNHRGRLIMSAHRGFAADFLSYFAVVDPSQPTACAQAMTTRQAVYVDDVSRSPIFDGQETRCVMLDSGTRAVQSYPLLTERGQVMGVLSFHFPARAPERATTALVMARASAALSLASPP